MPSARRPSGPLTCSDRTTARPSAEKSASSKVKVRVDPFGDDRFEVTGIVYSSDDYTWSWRFKHEEDISAKGEAKADGDGEGRSFKVVRTMVNFPGAADHIVFRAENEHTGEVCRVDVNA